MSPSVQKSSANNNAIFSVDSSRKMNTYTEN